MDGVALGARFSLATNRLNFCGPADAEPTLYRAITEGTDLGPARAALERFEALFPYLEAIGAKHDLDPFDRQVVEAYWIGNRLLDAFAPDDFRAILAALSRRGLPRATAERLAAHLPSDPIPHHAFHVSFVGVGEVTGHVATTLANMEQCRPARASVSRVQAGTLDVEHPELSLDGGRLVLTGRRVETLPYDPRILPGLRPGAEVALHWRHPALLLDRDRAERLGRYSARSFAAASEGLERLRLLR